MRLRSFHPTVLLACTLLACSSDDSKENSDGAGASAEDVAACKAGCDKMKFFQCNSASEQSRCYADCGEATSAQIEVFVGCAQNSICDPECRTTIQPPPASGGKPSGGGASSESCAAACDKAIACSFIKLGDKDACLELCRTEAYQYQIDCVVHHACNEIPTVCGLVDTGGTSDGGTTGTGTGGTEGASTIECQSNCQSLAFDECIDATALAECNDLCVSAEAVDIEAFNGCAQGAFGDCEGGEACLAALKK